MNIVKWTRDVMEVEYFLTCNKLEMEELKNLYNAKFFESFSFNGDDFYCFLSKKNHTITPMRLPSDGFAGQYNGYQFEDINDFFDFNPDEYNYQFDLPFFQELWPTRQEMVVEKILEKQLEKVH